MKKALALVLSFMLCLGMLPVAAFSGGTIPSAAAAESSTGIPESASNSDGSTDSGTSEAESKPGYDKDGKFDLKLACKYYLTLKEAEAKDFLKSLPKKDRTALKEYVKEQKKHGTDGTSTDGTAESAASEGTAPAAETDFGEAPASETHSGNASGSEPEPGEAAPEIVISTDDASSENRPDASDSAEADAESPVSEGTSDSETDSSSTITVGAEGENAAAEAEPEPDTEEEEKGSESDPNEPVEIPEEYQADVDEANLLLEEMLAEAEQAAAEGLDAEAELLEQELLLEAEKIEMELESSDAADPELENIDITSPEQTANCTAEQASAVQGTALQASTDQEEAAPGDEAPEFAGVEAAETEAAEVETAEAKTAETETAETETAEAETAETETPDGTGSDYVETDESVAASDENAVIESAKGTSANSATADGDVSATDAARAPEESAASDSEAPDAGGPVSGDVAPAAASASDSPESHSDPPENSEEMNSDTAETNSDPAEATADAQTDAPAFNAETEYAAEVYNWSGSLVGQYGSLTDAYNNAQPRQQIKLLGNADDALTIGKELLLDLNGYDWVRSGVSFRSATPEERSAFCAGSDPALIILSYDSAGNAFQFRGSYTIHYEVGGSTSATVTRPTSPAEGTGIYLDSDLTVSNARKARSNGVDANPKYASFAGWYLDEWLTPDDTRITVNGTVSQSSVSVTNCTLKAVAAPAWPTETNEDGSYDTSITLYPKWMWSVVLACNNYGSVQCNGTEVSSGTAMYLEEGSRPEFIFTPNAGYHVYRATIKVKSYGETYQGEINYYTPSWYEDFQDGLGTADHGLQISQTIVVTFVRGTQHTVSAKVTASDATPGLNQDMTFTVRIENLTDEDLSNVKVSVPDGDLLAPASSTPVSNSVIVPSIKAKGSASLLAHHTVTSEDILNGSYSLSATVVCDDDTVTSKSAEGKTAGINVKLELFSALTDKSAVVYQLGDEVGYTVTVENTGNVDLLNTVIDLPADTVITPDPSRYTIEGNRVTFGAISANTREEFKVKHTVTSEDVTAGTVTFKVTGKADSITGAGGAVIEAEAENTNTSARTNGVTYFVNYFLRGRSAADYFSMSAPEGGIESGVEEIGVETSVKAPEDVPFAVFSGNVHYSLTCVDQITTSSDASQNIVKVYYDEDEIGGTDTGDKYYPGDGTPDRDQVLIICSIYNGTWDGKEDRDSQEYLLPIPYGQQSSHYLKEYLPTGMVADAPYSLNAGSWHIGTYDGPTVDPSTTTVSGDMEYVYSYGDKVNEYTISVSALNCTATATIDGETAEIKNGKLSVNYGETCVISFTASSGYTLSAVLVDGTSKTLTNNCYTFYGEGTTASHSIVVQYKSSTSTSSTSSTTTTGSGAETGDDSHALLWAGIGGISLICTAAMILLTKKKTVRK